MRRAVMGSEVGSSLSPGWGAMHEFRRSAPRFRIGEAYKIAGWSVLALLAFAALGHMH